MKQVRFAIPWAILLLAAALPLSMAAINVALGSLAMLWFVAATQDERQKSWNAVLPLLPWMVAYIISWAISEKASPSALSHFWSLMALPLTASFILKVPQDRWLRWYAVVLLVVSLVAITQWLGGSGILDVGLHSRLSRGDLGGMRALGFFNNPLTFGGVLMFGVLSMTAVYVERKRTFFALVAVLGLAALTVTFARNAWLGFTAGLFPILLLHRNAWKWVLPAILVVGMLFAVSPALRHRMFSLTSVDTNPATSTGTRLFLWRDAWAQFRERPITGWGPGTFRDNVTLRHPNVPLKTRAHAHNNYLQVLAETGLLGLMGFLTMLAWLGIRTLRSRPSPLRTGALANLTAFIVAGIFECSFFDTEVAVSLLVWLAWAWQGAPTPSLDFSDTVV